MCPSEHVWPASQHPLERDVTVIKNNNVKRGFFSVNRQLYCIIVQLGESNLNLYLKFWDEKEWFRSGFSVITQIPCIITHL